MTRKQIGAVCGAILLAVITPLLVLGLLHALDSTARAQPPPSYTKVSMPDFGQHSQSWCWVGAAANSFWWYAENVAGQEGLLGGALKPWKTIDPNSQNPGDACWYDANDLAQGYGGPLPIPGYRQVLSMIAQTTFMDANQSGIQDVGEASYCYNQGVEKWDYLIGLRDYVNNYGSGLTVHDIIDPVKCGVGTGMIPTRQFPPTMNSLDPCGPGGTGVPGVNQVVLPPTFLDYQTELSNSQDVLLWMESTSPETAHVVTGVGYDTTPDPDTITISDPWTRNANPPVAPHDDTWNVSDPSHNNAPGHTPSPYDVCTVVNPGPTPKFTINCGGTIWTVYDMIFVSPAVGADIKVLTFQSDPPGPFTFDVSTYNVINLFEDKHNNGPLDADVDVSWSIDPIEDRDGDGIPDINVRWHALVGDLCTYQGLPVACGEGDGVGTGGSGDGFPSLTGDNCQDDIDNDGDNTCDVNGCTAFPNSPDPDCGDVDDIHFQISLPVSVADVVERELKLHCKPRSDTQPYTITLYNDEWPVDVEELDPSNNFAQLDIDVICQVADPHYKCYDIFDATAPPVGELVTLEDQFNPVPVTDVAVEDPVELCPPAIKYLDGEYAGGGTAAPHLKCYNIVGMPDPDATVNLTDQFGTETDIPVGAAQQLCIPTLKEVTYPEPVPPPPPPVPLEPHYVCYDIPPATPPPGIIIDLETQFGFEPDVQFSSTTPNKLCAPALKNDDGNLDAPHLRCYAIDSTDDPIHRVNLQTQFPLETDVEINQPAYMCVPVVKEHTDADVKILSQTIYAEDCISDPPTDIDVSADVVICVDKVLHNNGPYTPVNVDIAKTASAPAGCTILPGSDTDQVLLDNSITVSHQEWFTIHCDEPSTHGPFTIDNVISIKDPGITDPDTTNNTASSSIGVNAWAYADIQIVGQQILAANCLDPAPTEIPLSEDVTICVHKLLHNDGPYAAQPVQVDVTKTTWASAGATILPPTHSVQLELYYSDVVPHVEYFTIHCYEPSTHEFRVDNDVTVKDEHVIDPDGASASGSIFVDCLASTDIKITSQSFLSPPAQMIVGVPELVILRKQLHNNGGYGPATVDINKTAYTNSPNATIAPPSDSDQVDLPVSSTVIHDEVFTLNCSAPGIYTYTVDNDVTSKEPHISGGAFASTDLIVECVAAPTGVHYEAFSIFGDPLPVPPVDIETQFGTELGVEVGLPVTLMAPALKNGEGTLDATHLKCYDIASSEDPFHLVDLTTQFGFEEDVEVGPARELCVPAAKEVLEPFPAPPGPLETEPHYKCYEITGGPLIIPVELVTQFGLDSTLLDVPTRLCAPALKNGEPGNLDDYPHLKCYDIPPGLSPGYIVNLETQFGLELGIEVGPALRLCMPAVKDLVCQPGAIPPVDTDGDTFTDDVETYLPTDCLDDCTDNPGVHDAWPLDINMDKYVTVVGDVLAYAGRMGAWGGPPPDPLWVQRLDLNADNFITVVGDVLKFSGKVGGPPCT